MLISYDFPWFLCIFAGPRHTRVCPGTGRVRWTSMDRGFVLSADLAEMLAELGFSLKLRGNDAAWHQAAASDAAMRWFFVIWKK